MRVSDVLFGAIIIAIPLAAAQAEEGMWTFNDFPFDRVERAYGFRPDQAWLDHLRLSSLRLARGCSASFVSPQGLVQTNHHCASVCIEQLSTGTRDYIANGFYAKEATDEIKCPDIEANQLVAITDVTERIKRATAGKDGEAFAEAKKAERAVIEKECSANDPSIRCDVVEFYQGGRHDLYRYRRYQDVRLVFAPEKSIAFFGGDPDNFEFPRYNLDVSYLRVYADGKPLETSANYLRYAARDVQPRDLTFTSGHPGKTNRLITVAELEFQRDVVLPSTIFRDSELRGILTEFSSRGPEQARIAGGELFGLENALKAQKGKFAALIDPKIIRERVQSERQLRERVQTDPQMKDHAAAWDQIAAAVERYRGMRNRHVFTEGRQGFRSKLFGHALALVRRAAEAKKPDEKRLQEYTDAKFPTLLQSITSTAPIYPELEKLTLTFSLTKLRETLGPDDAFVKKVLGKKSPAALAAELVDGSTLTDVRVRNRLLEADEAAIAASSDSMVVFARMIDPDLRAVRKDYEDNIEAPSSKYAAQIADARFKLYGVTGYPDATFTLRISYGSVQGYRVGGREIDPITTIGGAFDRATGSDPFKLPDTWIATQTRLNHSQPFNVATTNDIIGGNSGSPVVNKAREVVGLIFDGNIQSLGGDFGYDGAANRAVAVNVGALREALSKVYRADRLVAETTP
jgi:peptidase S46-like protein